MTNPTAEKVFGVIHYNPSVPNSVDLLPQEWLEESVTNIHMDTIENCAAMPLLRSYTLSRTGYAIAVLSLEMNDARLEPELSSSSRVRAIW